MAFTINKKNIEEIIVTVIEALKQHNDDYEFEGFHESDAYNELVKNMPKFLEKILKPKQAKDKDAPKKPCNAYAFFFKEKSKTVTDLKSTERMSKIGEMWRELDAEDKETYQEQSNNDKNRYEAELKEYELKKLQEGGSENEDKSKSNKSSKSKTKLKTKDENKTYRSGYNLFQSTYSKQLKNDGFKGNLLAEVAKKWSELTKDVQKLYNDRVASSKLEYQNKVPSPKTSFTDTDIGVNDNTSESETLPEKKSPKVSNKSESEVEDLRPQPENKSKSPKRPKSPKVSGESESELVDEPKRKPKKSKSPKKSKKSKSPKVSDESDNELVDESESESEQPKLLSKKKN